MEQLGRHDVVVRKWETWALGQAYREATCKRCQMTVSRSYYYDAFPPDRARRVERELSREIRDEFRSTPCVPEGGGRLGNHVSVGVRESGPLAGNASQGPGWQVEEVANGE